MGRVRGPAEGQAYLRALGCGRVRWVLCEAAQTAKRHPDFAPAYEAIARRRGKKIATTAIARKLLTRAYHLLTDAGTGR
jgi:transposase